MSNNLPEIKKLREENYTLKEQNIRLRRRKNVIPLSEDQEKLLRSFESESDRKVREYFQKGKQIDTTGHEIEENECKIRENELQIEKLEQQDKEPSFQGSGLIRLDSDHQTIEVGGYAFENFDSFFSLTRAKDSKRKAQIKGGVSLIYAIAKYEDRGGNKNDMLISDLFVYCKEFKANRSNWVFEKKGAVKENITKNDCDSAITILHCCDLSVTLKLSRDKTKISMTE